MRINEETVVGGDGHEGLLIKFWVDRCVRAPENKNGVLHIA